MVTQIYGDIYLLGYLNLIYVSLLLHDLLCWSCLLDTCSTIIFGSPHNIVMDCNSCNVCGYYSSTQDSISFLFLTFYQCYLSQVHRVQLLLPDTHSTGCGPVYINTCAVWPADWTNWLVMLSHERPFRNTGTLCGEAMSLSALRVNSLPPGRCGSNCKNIIFKLVIQDISLANLWNCSKCKWMLQNLAN